MLGSDVMRGYNDMLILCLLLEGDSYGYAISREIEQRSGGEYPIKETTLYSAFGRLEKQGYIVPYQAARRRAGRAPITPSRTKGEKPMPPNARSGGCSRPWWTVLQRRI